LLELCGRAGRGRGELRAALPAAAGS
jgi:hypothetical protein